MIRWLAVLWVCFALALVPDSARADELRPAYIEMTEQSPGQWSVLWKASTNSRLGQSSQVIIPANCRIEGERERKFAGSNILTRLALRCDGSLQGQSIGLKGLELSTTDALVRIAPIDGAMQTLRLTPDQPHSLTLVGTTLGWLSLPSRPVESVIALSIVFLAVEIVKAKPGDPRLSERFPWIVAFLFGLLHGFGFAGALAEIGLPEDDVPLALLTFNLGVEIGQLVIVAVALAVLYGLRHYRDRWLNPAKTATAYGIGIIATYWFIERTFA